MKTCYYVFVVNNRSKQMEYVGLDNLRATKYVKRIAFGAFDYENKKKELRKLATSYEMTGQKSYDGNGIYTEYNALIGGITVLVSEQYERNYASAVYVICETKADYEKLKKLLKEQREAYLATLTI